MFDICVSNLIKDLYNLIRRTALWPIQETWVIDKDIRFYVWFTNIKICNMKFHIYGNYKSHSALPPPPTGVICVKPDCLLNINYLVSQTFLHACHEKASRNMY